MAVGASVVINNYNYGRFLPAAIESALSQTHRPLEVVVVDDGSTDESRSVIAAYGDRVVPVMKANGGQGSALNAGFAAARGDVILFLDADDVLLPGAAARAVECLREPGVVKAHWPLWEIDARGARTGGVQPRAALPDGDMRDLIIREGPGACPTPPTSANAWSRAFLERVLPMPEKEFHINSDGYLVTLAWVYGLVRKVAEPQGFYRIHGANHFAVKRQRDRSDRVFEMYMHRCQVLDEHLRAMGVYADAEAWRLKKGFYRWRERVWQAKQAIAAVIPADGRFILVDEDAFGDPVGTDGVLAGREVLPFPECDGCYAGRPADDATAITELRRLHAGGAGHIVFAWHTFWWLDHYTAFARHLRDHHTCVQADDVVRVYRLRG